MLKDRRTHTWDQGKSKLEILVNPDRHGVESLRLDVRANVGAVGLHDGSSPGDGHRLRNGARLKGNVHAGGSVDGDIDAGPDFLLEALRRNRHGVVAGGEIRKRIVAAPVGDFGVNDSGGILGNRHRRFGNNGARVIGHRSYECGVHCLRQQRVRCAKHEQNENRPLNES